MPPLRILQVLPSLEMGGVEENTIQDAIIFKENGIVPFVASSGGKMKKRLNAEFIQHFHMPLNWKNPIMLLINALWLIILIYLKQIDIIHARSRAPAWSAYIACKLTGRKFITTFHGYYSGFNNPIKKHYNKVMTFGEKVIVSNDFMKKHVEQYYNCPSEKIVVMPRGVDVNQFKNIDNNRIKKIYSEYGTKNIILVPGRIVEWKGQHIFLEAFRQIQSYNLNYLGILMGKGNNDSSYYKKIKEFISLHNLNIIIEEDFYDIPALYKAALCVILPSIKYETFGRCGIEALISQKNIIATKFNISLPLGSYIEYDYKNPEDLGRKIKALENNSLDKFFDRTNNCFNLEKYAEKLLSIINVYYGNRTRTT